MEVRSPMAGVLLRVEVAEGERVGDGQQVAVLESMKMEVGVPAEQGGEVAEIRAAAGDFVQEGDVLLVLR